MSCVVALLDANDEAPIKLAAHFKKVISDFKMDTWSHYLYPPMKPLLKFDPKVLAEHRGFDPSPEALWLGPKLLYRSLHSLFSSIRKLYHSYNPNSFLSAISAHLGNDFSIRDDSLQISLRRAFPELAPKKRGRKRKRDLAQLKSDGEAELKSDGEGFDSVLLEGVTSKRKKTALLFKWTHLPIKKSSWQLLSIQSQDFQDWWAEEREVRYPLTPPAAFQVNLVQTTRNQIERS